MTSGIGLDAIIAPPPLGAALAVLLVAGCDALGVISARTIFSFARREDPAWQRWQAPVIGVIVVSFVVYPLALGGLTPALVLRGMAALLAAAGAAHLWRLRRGLVVMLRTLHALWRDGAGFDRVALVLSGLVLSGLALAALGPVTSADALDYHMGVALELLRHGAMPVRPEWFHSRLAASGEVLNALGLAVGAEAFGALLQYAGVIAVAALLAGVSAETAGSAPEARSRGLLLVLTALSAPVLLFLATAPKPQLLYGAMTTLALALTVAPSRRTASPLRNCALIVLLATTAAAAKLSFLLTGGCIVLVALVLTWRRGYDVAGLLVAGACVLAVLAAPLLWKMQRYDAALLEALTAPLPGRWPGSDAFAADLRLFADSSVPFPASLVIPASLGAITTIIGIGPVIFLGLGKGAGRLAWMVVALAVVVGMVAAGIGQRTSRFFLEMYFWLLLACALAPALSLRPRVARWGVALQGAGMAVVCWFAAATLFPGAVRAEWRQSVMQRTADGYDVMSWLDRVLPPDGVVLSEHRSLALAPRAAVAYDWVSRVGQDSASWRPYLALLRDRGVTHLLRLDESSVYFRDCLGGVAAGPEPVRRATRNPFNRGPRANAYLFALRAERLPDCALASLHNALHSPNRAR